MKNEKGVTLIVLVVMVIMMIILAGVAVGQGQSSYSEVKLQNFSYEMQQIQGRVDTLHEKIIMSGTTENMYIKFKEEELGDDITSLSGDKVKKALFWGAGIDFDSEEKEEGNFYHYTGVVYKTYYRYFDKAALEEILDIKNPQLEVIINFKTREVISVDGFEYENKTYYTLDDMK